MWSQGAQAEVAADVDDHLADDGVELHVFVRVGVVQRQAGFAKGLELGANFGGELAAGAGADGVAQA